MSRLNNTKFWLEFFTWLITALAILFVIGWVFFTVRGNWDFLREIDFYSKTSVTTLLAIVLRWLWHRKGRDSAREEDEIKTLENSKTKRINKLSECDLVNKLEKVVESKVENNKALAYRDKCDFKIMKYRKRKRKREYWVEEKDKINKWLNGDKQHINIKTIKRVSHYRFTPAQILTVNNEYAPSHSIQRANAGSQMVRSYQLNIFTTLSYAFVYGVELMFRDFGLESILMIIVQSLILVTNIGVGVYLGMKFIQTDYKNDLVHDIGFLDNFLKENIVSG